MTKPIEDLELREAVAVDVMGVHVRKQRGARSHLRDLVIPGGVNGIDFVQEEGEPELTVRDLIGGVPAYESSIEAAFAVVEKMREKGWDFYRLNADQTNRGGYVIDIHGAAFGRYRDDGNYEVLAESDGDTAPLAIARLNALLAEAREGLETALHDHVAIEGDQASTAVKVARAILAKLGA